MSGQDVLDELRERGFEVAEVFAKKGRTRRLVLAGRGDESGRRRSKVETQEIDSATARSTGARSTGFHEEAGWAVRAGDARRSLFCAWTGAPRSGMPLPEADGLPLVLPRPPKSEASGGEGTEGAGWRDPSELDSPLAGEREGYELLTALEQLLIEDLPSARLESAILEDGHSEVELANSHGVSAKYRSRAASLRLEASLPGRAPVSAVLVATGRDVRSFTAQALARRLADRLLVEWRGRRPSRDRGEFLLAPAVASRLVAALVPALVGPEAQALAAGLERRGRPLGSSAVTVIDNGRLPGGLLAAPVDGEGVPTREVVLIEEGVFRQPLLSWRSTRETRQRASGCSLRAGWRDLPLPGPTHLFIRPDTERSVGSMLGEVVRGYYLLDVTGPGRFDLRGDRFALPVCGFAVEGGRAVGPVSGAWLCGGFGSFLRGVQAVGRDLTFLPLDGMLGSPSLLVNGLELRSEP